MRKINELVVHHSGNTSTVRDIRKLHVEKNGWDDIGYHLLISRDGSIHQGRPFFREGAHVKGHNRESLGICLLGNLDEEEPTTAQLSTLIKVLSKLMEDFKIGPDSVRGHREFPRVEKSCPGRKIDLDRLRSELKSNFLKDSS